MPKKSFFIVFEGLDGSGQSTQVKLFAEYLKKRGFEVVTTKEPTLRSPAGRKIHQVIKKEIKLGAKKLQELFSKDRRLHLKNVIIPALKEGKMVVSDRYFFSSFAFGKASGIGMDWLEKQNGKFPAPALTFILDVRPGVSLARIEKRGKPKELFEVKTKLAGVRKIYKTFPNKFENVHLINGEKPIQKVFQDVKKIVRSKLNI